MRRLSHSPIARPVGQSTIGRGSQRLAPLCRQAAAGSGGLGVRFATTADLLLFPSQKSVLQRFVAGEAASAVYVAANGRAEFLGATRQLLGRDVGLPAEFAYAGTIAPLIVSPVEMQASHRLGGVLAREFGLVGLFGVDFVRAQGEIWVIEVNPRYTASVEVLRARARLAAVGRSCRSLHSRNTARRFAAA